MQLSATSEPQENAAGAGGAAADGAAQLPAIREGRELQSKSTGATNSTGAGSRGIAGAAVAAAVAAGAAGAAAVAAGKPPPPIRVSSSSTGGVERAEVTASGSGIIDAFVRDASQTVTHDKVQDWLQSGTSSSELSPALQQKLQDQRRQQEQQQPPADAKDVFGAEDSPFFLLPTCMSSGSVELGAFKQGGFGHAGTAAAATSGGFAGSMPSFMDDPK